MKLWMMMVTGILLLGCERTSRPPDPKQFPPFEDQVNVDPREISFHNESVEMAALEVFSPAKPIKDCKAEAPHRLLCPSEYRVILKRRVYPRTVVKTYYPKDIPLDCAQVWVRVATKALEVEGHREAIFLLNSSKPLVLELEDGVTARLDQKGLGAPNQFPPPLKYCDPAHPGVTVAPKDRNRTAAAISSFVAKSAPALKSCCTSPQLCRRPVQVTVTLKRDGSILQSALEAKTTKKTSASKDKARLDFQACLHKELSKFRFPGFTPQLTTAALVYRIRAGR